MTAGIRCGSCCPAIAEADGFEVGPAGFATTFEPARFGVVRAWPCFRDRDMQYWADPFQNEPGAINTWDGGRGIYFEDPNGHLLEAITRPYGTGGTTTDHPHPLLAATDAG